MPEFLKIILCFGVMIAAAVFLVHWLSGQPPKRFPPPIDSEMPDTHKAALKALFDVPEDSGLYAMGIVNDAGGFLNRSNVYQVLRELEEKNLISRALPPHQRAAMHEFSGLGPTHLRYVYSLTEQGLLHARGSIFSLTS